ncbi:MAG: hypothetical protein EP330_09660 [Deltaproteobacteria bacterium]|nr:MAG: hypothetical protein EP330_09660 [Deltaproteobacteria bacterium]
MRTAPLVIALVLVTGCKKDGCDPGDPDACKEGLTCDPLATADAEEEPQYICAEPVTLRGQVFDVSDNGAIEGARIVPLDNNGSVAGRVGVTNEAGVYETLVRVPRDEDGLPAASGSVTLRADAHTYQSFPGGLRRALPISLAEVTEVDGGWVLESELTDVGLIPLPSTAPTGRIQGTASVPDSQAGVLVVAESNGRGLTAIADVTGDYVIYNVPDGSWAVTGYALGVQHEEVGAEISSGGTATADIAIDGDADAVVDGTVQIVNAPGGSTTSVVLVVESTFDETIARGATPPGMRAPKGSYTPDISGAYSFEGVPDGRYVVLGAFENDGLVRDPDYTQGGTEILHIEVAGGDVTVDGFKLTEALEVFGPGAAGPEIVSSTPTFAWKDDSGEQSYDIAVFDYLGDEIWMTTIDGVSGSDPTLAYGGPALTAGYYYQFRVTSKDNAGVPISQTQDVDGVFQYLP